MAPLPDVPQVVAAVLKWDVGADLNAISKLHFHYTGSAPTASGFAGMATAIATAWNATGGMHSNVGSTTGLQAIEFTDLTSSTSAQGTASLGVGGTNAGALVGAGTAAVVSYHINRRYRGGKPRSYIPGQVGGFLATPQTWTSTYVTALLASWQAFIAAIQAAAPSGTTFDNQVNVSYFNDKARRTTPVVDVIHSMSVNPRVASQRRRNQQS